MKFLSYIFVISIILVNIMTAQTIDVSKKPESLPAGEFKFPSHKEKTLPNGLKIFVIEDKAQPTLSLNLLIPGGTSVDTKAGTADLLAALLTKGAGKRSAQQIANEIDGVGASISASSTGDYITVSASGLKKHMKLILDIYTDVVLKPSLPEDEFEKLQKQMIAGLINDKSQPSKLGAILARKVLYGENHPYANSATEKSVESIEIDDIKQYYNTYFKPNQASIAIIGDVNADEVFKAIDKSFGDWKKGKSLEIKIPEAKAMPKGVYFINRPGSTQSTVIVTSLGVPSTDERYETLELAAKIIGSGFGGRLFRTLRETYSFTYSPWGYLTSSKYLNRFACGADVKMDKTDSSITVIMEQLQQLADEAPAADELNRLLKFELGQYYMSFENSSFLASLIQSADFLNIPLERFKSYPSRLQATSGKAISIMAYDFMNPKNAFIVVVGDPKVKQDLEKFGQIIEYNLDLEPISGEKAKMEKVSLSPEDLIKKHIDAIGGKSSIAAVSSMIVKSKSNMIIQGQSLEGDIIEYKKAPNKYYLKMDMGMFVQELWCNGQQAFSGQNGIFSEIKGKQYDKIMGDAIMFATTKLLENGFEMEVLGRQDGNIVAKAKSKAGEEYTYYFDAKTYLLNKYEQLEEMSNATYPVTVKMSNYQKVGDVMLPMLVETNSDIYKLKNENTYELNKEMDDQMFLPKK